MGKLAACPALWGVALLALVTVLALVYVIGFVA